MKHTPETLFQNFFAQGTPVPVVATIAQRDDSIKGQIGLPADRKTAADHGQFFNDIAKEMPTPKHLQAFEVKGAPGATPGYQAFQEAPEKKPALAAHGHHKATGNANNTRNGLHNISSGGNRVQSLNTMAARFAPT